MYRSSAIETALRIAAESKGLQLDFGGERVDTGRECPKRALLAPPEIHLDARLGPGTYLALALDIDAPFPSWDRFGPILHWLQSDLHSALDGKERQSHALTHGSPACVQYLPPNPLWPSTAHRILFLVYRQPSSFAASDFRATSIADWFTGPVPRIWFDLADFERRAKLDKPVAAMYLLAA